MKSCNHIRSTTPSSRSTAKDVNIPSSSKPPPQPSLSSARLFWSSTTGTEDSNRDWKSAVSGSGCSQRGTCSGVLEKKCTPATSSLLEGTLIPRRSSKLRLDRATLDRPLFFETSVLRRIVILEAARPSRSPPRFMIAVPLNGFLKTSRKRSGRFPPKLRTDLSGVDRVALHMSRPVRHHLEEGLRFS